MFFSPPPSEVAPVDHVRLDRPTFSQVNSTPHEDQTCQPLPQYSSCPTALGFHPHQPPEAPKDVFTSTVLFPLPSSCHHHIGLFLVTFSFWTSSPVVLFFSQAANTTNLFSLSQYLTEPFSCIMFSSYTIHPSDLGLIFLIFNFNQVLFNHLVLSVKNFYDPRCIQLSPCQRNSGLLRSTSAGLRSR